ncbi:hypothetical protein ACLB2K_011771 [Fragaria x ananassa]
MGAQRATSQWVTHPGIALGSACLTSEFPSPPKPLSSHKASHITIHPPWESDALVGTLAPHGRVALIPFVTSRDPLRRNTILSALGPPALTVLFMGAQRATSQWVTHPGIALGSACLTSEFSSPPKPLSSHKASR